MEADLVPGAAAIGMDTPCIHCGYNLRGLAPRGVCPECGRAIDESLRGDLLRHANANWLRRVRLGITVQVAGMVMAAVLIGVLTVLAFAEFIDPFYVGFVPWLLFILLTVAAFIYTVPEPKSRLTWRSLSTGNAIRLAAGLMLTAQIVSSFHGSIPFALYTLSSMLRSLAMSIVYVLSMILLRSLASRIPDAGLVRWSRVYVWSGAIVYSMVTIVNALAALAHVYTGELFTTYYLYSDEPSLFWIVVSIFANVASTATVLLSLMYLWLLWRYRRVLGQQIALATGCGGQVTG